MLICQQPDTGVPLTASRCIASRAGANQARAACSGERGFAVIEQQLMTDSGSEYVIDLLKPG
jgi:hypothetical protein